MTKAEEKFAGFLLSPHYKWQRHLLFLVVLTIISTGLAFNQGYDGTGIFFGIIYFNLLITGIMYINVCFAVPELLLKNKLIHYILTLIGLTVLLLSGVMLLGMILNIFDDLSGKMKWVLALNLLSSVILMILLIAGVTTLMLFRYWLASSQRVAQLESAKLQSELKFLKSQINPHFLFNMLNNTHALFKDNNQEASALLYKLGDLLRYQINESSKNEITLNAGIGFLNDYLNLEKVRRDHFSFTIYLEGDAEEIRVPPLLFIPFVENAVKHSQDSECPSWVTIRFSVVNSILNFHCENSLPPDYYSSHQRPGGIGLANIRRRLELLFTDKHHLQLIEKEGTFCVALQLIF